MKQVLLRIAAMIAIIYFVPQIIGLAMVLIAGWSLL
jgi:hypothetical protein